mgnify:CR=1 FL=1
MADNIPETWVIFLVVLLITVFINFFLAIAAGIILFCIFEMGKRHNWGEEKKIKYFVAALAFLIVQQAVLSPMISTRVTFGNEKQEFLELISDENGDKAYLNESLDFVVYPALLPIFRFVNIPFDSKVQIVAPPTSPLFRIVSTENGIQFDVLVDGWTVNQIGSQIRIRRHYDFLQAYGLSRVISSVVQIQSPPDQRIMLSWVMRNENGFPVHFNSTKFTMDMELITNSLDDLPENMCYCLRGENGSDAWFEGEKLTQDCRKRDSITALYTNGKLPVYISGEIGSNSEETISVSYYPQKYLIDGLKQTCSS